MSGEAATSGHSGPAISGSNDPRQLGCYAVRYDTAVEAALLLVLRSGGIPHRLLTFRRRLPRRQGIVRRRWLPGYLFVHLDLDRDLWQPLRRAPGVIELLGDPTPIPEEVYIDLCVRCPDILLVDDARSVIPAGSEVELTGGPFAGQRGVVVSSSGDVVWIETFMLNRNALRVRARTKHIRILG